MGMSSHHCKVNSVRESNDACIPEASDMASIAPLPNCHAVRPAITSFHATSMLRSAPVILACDWSV